MSKSRCRGTKLVTQSSLLYDNINLDPSFGIPLEILPDRDLLRPAGFGSVVHVGCVFCAKAARDLESGWWHAVRSAVDHGSGHVSGAPRRATLRGVNGGDGAV